MIRGRAPALRPARPAVLAAAVLVAAATVTGSQAAVDVASVSGWPFSHRALYAAPTAAAGAARAPGLAARDRAELRRLASVPQAVWLSGGSATVAAHTVARTMAAARDAVPAFVVYAIPHRDCSGGHSAGGLPGAAQYRRYVAAIAGALGSGPAIVVLEPDSLADLGCLTRAQQAGRLALERSAVHALSARPTTAVYLDGGVRGWQSPSTMAQRLAGAGVAAARGFAVNVSNFDATADEIDYGRAVSGRLGWKHFVVDTSRNGARVTGACNPRGAALGALPTTVTGHRGVDALLWVKHPGESDGACGASRQPAGRFDATAALSLIHARRQ